MSEQEKLTAMISDGFRDIPALGLRLSPHTADTAAQLELSRIALRQKVNAYKEDAGLGDDDLRELLVFYGAGNIALIHSQDCSQTVWKPKEHWERLRQFLSHYTKEQIENAYDALAEHITVASRVQDWKIEDAGTSPPNS